MPPVDLSIVIVSYNTRLLLGQCLTSLRAAAAPRSLEVIVVDNGSVDGSVEFVRMQYPDVICIDNPGNPGFAHATNRGLERASGQFWLWLNSDCVCPAASLAGLVDSLEAHPEAGAIGPRLVFPDGRQQPSAQAFPGVSRVLIHFLGLSALAKWPPTRALLVAVAPVLGGMTRGYLEALNPSAIEREVDWLSGACILVRADAARAAGPLDEGYFMYCEDTDWCQRLRATGWQVWWTPRVSVIHHVGASGASSPLVTYHHYRSLLRYFARYQPKSIVWLRVVMLVGCVARGIGCELGRLVETRPHAWWKLAGLAWRGIEVREKPA